MNILESTILYLFLVASGLCIALLAVTALDRIRSWCLRRKMIEQAKEQPMSENESEKS